MKKSLIALAALAVVSAASAQSSVTVSGNLDFAAASSSGTVSTMSNASTVSTNIGASSTSVIRFIAVEDLGGGLKATAQYNFDPRTLANDSGAVTNNGGASTTTGALGATFTGLQRDEMFVGLSGNFGNVRLGSPNSIGLGAHGDSSPLGTGIGAGYTANGVSGTMTNSYVQTRYNRSARYDSPTIAGFTASALYAPGGDEAAIVATTPATAGLNTALTIPNNRKATELGLSYANGPLKVSYAYVAQDAQTVATGWYAAAATSTSTSKTNVSMLNANYVLNVTALGATTLYAGWNSGDALKATGTVAPTSTKGYRVAVKQSVGAAVDLIAQYTTQDSTAAGAATVKAKVTGLRADYNLSKTAALYLGYENYDSGVNTTANIHKVTSLGLRKSF